MKCWNIVFKFFTTLPCPLKGKFSWVVEELTLVVAVVGVSEIGVCSGKLVVACPEGVLAVVVPAADV